jgi:hypothetical protein
MIATSNAVPVRRKHARNGDARPSRFALSSGADPVLDDLLKSATALSLEMATSQVKHLAKAGGISASRASRWRVHGEGNPLFDLTGLVYRLGAMGQHPGAVAAHVLTTLYHSLMPISDTDLVRRFWNLMDREGDAECRENKAQGRLAGGGSLEDLERATLEEAGVQQELAATIRELRRRGIDPRQD